MNVISAIETRRSFRQFDPNHEITEAEIERLISLAMLSPTPGNTQPWRFVVVRDKDLLSQIRAASYDQAQVTDSSLLVIMTADLSGWKTEPTRYARSAGPEMAEKLANSMMQFYIGREWLQRDDAMKSSGLAAMTLMLAAQELGYSSCPMGGIDLDAVGKLINLPDDHAISMFVAIGKPVAEAWPRGGQLPIEEVLVRDSFQRKALG
ncbi:nitroreductase family protein [Agrobacterium tumefaciens]|uniref:nitroreductase family protein n=1 Tax=Agrobacterium tumefaciens TaxID=358 RepID=UPI00129AA8BC|nr:nitroreductase family protein [Agrobacterium tumefaciens]MRH97968.1 nitroreductase family protein [Agrobacterium tumefaciens]